MVSGKRGSARRLATRAGGIIFIGAAIAGFALWKSRRPHCFAIAAFLAHIANMKKRPQTSVPIRTPALTLDAGIRPRRPYQAHGESTRRPGADGNDRRLGGVFDLKAAGFKRSVLVSGQTGRRSSSRDRNGQARHGWKSIGCPCASMMCWHRARTALLPRLFCHRKADWRAQPLLLSCIAEGLSAAGAALDRRRIPPKCSACMPHGEFLTWGGGAWLCRGRSSVPGCCPLMDDYDIGMC